MNDGDFEAPMNHPCFFFTTHLTVRPWNIMVTKRSKFLLGRVKRPIFRCVLVSFRETTAHLRSNLLEGSWVSCVLSTCISPRFQKETGDAENPAAQLMEEKDTEPRHWRRVPIEKDLPGTICYPVILWSCEYRSTISPQFNFEALSPKVRKTLWYLGKWFGARDDIFSY